MKNLFASIVCVLAMSSFTNNEVNENIINENKTVTFEEDFGRAGDCVRQARSATFAIASQWGESPNDDLDFYLDIYDAIYLDCYLN